MPIENERLFLPPEEKFTQGVSTRFELRNSIVNDSKVADDLKSAVRESLMNFRDGGLTKWQSLGDAFYSTIDRLLTQTKSWKKKNEADMVLFETLRDDLWDFHRDSD